MMWNNEESRLEIIDRLVAHVIERLPKEEAPLIKQFIRQYYLSVSPEDLTSKSVLDLYGAILSHWHYLSSRKKNEIKVRAYNPHLEQHGWQSTHTVIEIAFEDMPFLVDSVTMVLNRLGLNVHFIIHMGSLRIRRDEKGKVTEILDQLNPDESVQSEAAIFIEVDRQSDPQILETIEENIRKVLNDVCTIVYDWPKMRDQALNTIKVLESYNNFLQEKEMLKETIAFIQWLVEDHFTFTGYLEYRLEGEGEEETFRMVENSGLGTMKDPSLDIKIRPLADMPNRAKEAIFSNEILILGKTNIRSDVHRPAYTDFIAVKIFNTDGKIIGQKVFLGLYTAVAYNSSPRQIPYLRRKVKMILELAGFVPRSHDDRALLNILETLPRDDLFQASVGELLHLSTGILHLLERQRIRLFVRCDTFGYFISCLVFVPRDTYSSYLREKFQDILMRAFHAEEIEFTTRFSESVLARIHFVIRVNPKKEIEFDIKAIEKKLIEAGRTWREELCTALVEHYGEEQGNEFYKRYGDGFPAGYRETFSARVAVVDIEYFDTLSDLRPLGMSLYRNVEDTPDVLRFKLYRMKATIPLSDVVPILEKMGLRIISERPYEIKLKANVSIWINDYRMVLTKGEQLNIEEVREIFQDAFDHIWRGLSENDSFNRLVLIAKLNWREISVLRAYAKYLWQAAFTFSQNSIEDAMVANSAITFELMKLFNMRFNPELLGPESDQLNQRKMIEELLEHVSLNEDRILRRYLDIIMATIRTNFYQIGHDESHKEYISFKIHSARVPELPLPIPLFEIFVYSPRVEGIHLRTAKVARGGIRHSDRREDFRTEILDLVKTQQVKNSIIVPMGAKGGFVVKKSPEHGSREEIYDEIIYCYQTFIRGLLDITDNIKKEGIISPQNVVRYDEDDPYLVVAADKGTASFSDIANSLSKEYDFWLGDAFASGGSTGYDHKKMGITARGAWESVKRHFLEMDFDYENNDFSVIGIGDMSGDVFGNGMLLSSHIKLIAAFDHRHIFLDPNPDPIASFAERDRLFKLPRSSWADYNKELISKGGGVFDRKAKSIVLTPEVKTALDFHYERVTPNDLIRAILKAPVILFWNGGIGTYVKASTENNSTVGDRSNDAVRINGADLRCKVVGEGGNLGFTQMGRIEYAKKGGRLNTDAIDNSGGVNCSDNEVNIKILLNDYVERGDLTVKQRNELLVLMQDEVSELVLWNNRRQTEAISITISQAPENIDMHARLIQELEKTGNLNRSLEYLPDAEELALRKANKTGLTRPEVAVLMAYSKIFLKQALLKSDVPDEHYMLKALEHAFPAVLRVGFKDGMERHYLKREIIATRVSNITINEMGINFIYRLKDETGAYESDIVRAYAIAREVFGALELKKEIHQLSGVVEATILLKMIQEVNRLIRRGVRWFLRNRGSNLPIEELIYQFKPHIQEVSEYLPKFIESYGQEISHTEKMLIEALVPIELAKKIAHTSAMFSSLDIVEGALSHQFPLQTFTEIYFAIGKKLHLDWFRESIKKHTITNHWEALARATYRDDLDRQQRNLSISILKMNGEKFEDINALIEHWLKSHTLLIGRWDYFINELKNTTDADFTMFSVALRELLDLSQINNVGTKKVKKIKK